MNRNRHLQYPQSNGRGITVAMLALALCGLIGAMGRLDRASDGAVASATRNSRRAFPAESTGVPARPSGTPSNITPRFVDWTGELNARTRDAAALFEQGDYSRAAALVREAMRELPNASPEARQSALCYLGASLKRMGAAMQADAVLHEAVNLAPDTMEAAQAIKWLNHQPARHVEMF